MAAIRRQRERREVSIDVSFSGGGAVSIRSARGPRVVSPNANAYDAGGMETARKRPWWRYLRLSVRGLMLVVLAVGGCLGWWLHLAGVQRQAVAAIRGAGGRVRYEWDVRRQSRRPGGADGWRSMSTSISQATSFKRGTVPTCSDAEMAQVAQFDHLELWTLAART